MPGVVQVLAEVLARRERDARDLEPVQILGRNRDGTSRVRPQTGECELRGAITPYREGQIIEAPPRAPFNLRGSLGAPAGSRLGGATVWVERLEPEIFLRGESLTVEVHGRGFGSSTVFEFLLPDSETVNPDITITDQRLLTAELVELDLTIAAEALVFEAADLAYGHQVGG